MIFLFIKKIKNSEHVFVANDTFPNIFVKKNINSKNKFLKIILKTN